MKRKILTGIGIFLWTIRVSAEKEVEGFLFDFPEPTLQDFIRLWPALIPLTIGAIVIFILERSNK